MLTSYLRKGKVADGRLALLRRRAHIHRFPGLHNLKRRGPHTLNRETVAKAMDRKEKGVHIDLIPKERERERQRKETLRQGKDKDRKRGSCRPDTLINGKGKGFIMKRNPRTG